MPTPDIDTVKSILLRNDRDLKIRSAIDQAWVQVQKKYPDRAWWRRKSTLRHVMWEQCVDEAMAVVEDDPGLAAIEHYDTASFIADDTVLFRLKKADRRLFSSNFPTPLASMFHSHEADLFGHEGFHRVEIVHTFNRFSTAIEWIGVVAREDKRVIWDFELRKGEGVVLEFPALPTAPAGPSVIRPTMPDVPDVRDQSENAE